MMSRAISPTSPFRPEDAAVDVEGLAIDAALTEDAMRVWAHQFARTLPSGSVVALHGPMGAGKTSLVRMMCEALGVQALSHVTSPTFALVHEYLGAHGVIAHADLYRLRRPEELEQIGWDDVLTRAALTIIEWPEHGGSFVPPGALHVHLDHVAGRSDVRRLVWSA